MSRFISDKGLMGTLEQVGNSVKDRTAAVKEQTSELVMTALGFLGVPYRRGGNSVETGGIGASCTPRLSNSIPGRLANDTA